MRQLELKLQMHTQLKFPDFPEDDDFAEWVAELSELDGYYFGIARSLLGHCKVDEINFSHLEKLKEKLPRFSSIDEDAQIYRQCVSYICSIEDYVGQMR